MLTKHQILAARPRVREIDVPEWGGSVYIRPMTEAERARFADLANRFDKATPGEKIRNITFPIILWAVCDDSGTPFFADVKEVATLAETSPSSAFLRLQEAIFDLSAFTKEAREELEKNSPPIPSGDSSSA